MLKRAIFVSILLPLCLVHPSHAFSFPAKNPVHEYLRAEIEKQASAALGREVKIGSVGGNMITSLTLYDVDIAKEKKISQGRMLSVKRARIGYNALRGVLSKDMLQALTSIHLEKPDVYVEHEKDGSWNFEKLLASPDAGGGAAPVFRAKISVSDGKAIFVDKRGFGEPIKEKFEIGLGQINGAANFSKTDRISFRFAGNSREGPIKVDGKVFFSDLKTDIKLAAKDIDLKKWNGYLGLPFAKDIPMSGTADVDLLLSTLPGLKLKATILLKDSMIYDRPAKGEMLLSMDRQRFSLSLNRAEFCSGGVEGSFTAAMNGRSPDLSGRFDISKIDMSVLASQVPNVSGRASGSVDISGNGSRLGIAGKLSFSQGSLFGQKLEGASSSVEINNGDVNIDSVRLYSEQRELSARGYVKKDNNFVLETRVRGFELQDPDTFNGVYVTVDNFTGRISGRMDKKTLEHPLKNIEAEGMLLLSSGRIGSQRIARAQGRARLSGGMLESEGFSVVLESGGFLLSGNIGINRQSDFKIIGKNLDLADLKIIDDLLPEGAKGVSGTGDLVVSVGGYLSESGNIAEAVKTLDISVEANVSGASLGVKGIKNARLSAVWKNNLLLLKDLYFETPNSKLFASGRTDSSGNLTGSFDGDIFISDFSPFVQRYAKVLGRLSFKGALSGTVSAPDISAAFTASGINYNNIEFDRLSGKIRYKNKVFYLEDPAILTYGKDEYSVYGRLSLDGAGVAAYSGGVYTDRGNLNSLSSIAKMVYKEFGKDENISGSKKIAGQVFPDINRYRTPKGEYNLFDAKNGFLKKWLQASQKHTAEQEDKGIAALFLGMAAEAPLGLRAEFSGNSRTVSASGSFKTSKGNISSYGFDSISGTLILEKNGLVLRDLTVRKSPGELSASGRVSFSGPLSLVFKADSFNVTGADKILKLGIPVEGILDLDATVSGTYSDPKIDCVFSGTDAGVADISIDRMDADLSYGKGQLNIRNMSMNAGRQVASMEGVIPFVKGKEISLDLNLNGDNVGLLASLIKGVRWNSGAGAARLRASGTLERPKLNGVLSVQNAVLDIDQLKTTLYGFDADMSFEDSRISAKKFSGILSGDRTGGRPLPFSLAGHVDFSEAFTEKKKTEVNLSVADTSGYIDIPGIYSGEFSLSVCRLKGPLVLPGGDSKTGNMLVSAAVRLKDGSIFLPKGGGDSPKPNIEFDVSAAIGKNMRLVQGSGGQALSMDLANMNLEIFGEDLLLSGPIASPVVNGNVEIRSGSLSILGREFNIVNEYEQEKYFGSDRSLITKNEAVFQGGEKPYSAIPYIRITAKSDILSYSKTAAEKYPDGSVSAPALKKETNIIITKVSGMPFVQDKARMIQPSFYAFKLDTSKSPAEPVPADYDQNQIRIMLLPDFLKSSLGVSDGGAQGGIDANAIIVDYLNARLQSYLFRGVTSRVEQALGLESFSLDYNFGRDLEKFLPTKRGEYGVNETPQFGVGFVKGIFDNVFIQVRYAQALEQTALVSNMSLNYQITWKATRFYSLVYYREPVTFQQQDSTYYKATLQFQYLF